jgi:hypothetical protein
MNCRAAKYITIEAIHANGFSEDALHKKTKNDIKQKIEKNKSKPNISLSPIAYL